MTPATQTVLLALLERIANALERAHPDPADRFGAIAPVTVSPAVPPDAAGWIQWRGGEPPLPYGTRVDICHRDGYHWIDEPIAFVAAAPAARQFWLHTGPDRAKHLDIIAYRIAK